MSCGIQPVHHFLYCRNWWKLSVRSFLWPGKWRFFSPPLWPEKAVRWQFPQYQNHRVCEMPADLYASAGGKRCGKWQATSTNWLSVIFCSNRSISGGVVLLFFEVKPGAICCWKISAALYTELCAVLQRYTTRAAGLASTPLWARFLHGLIKMFRW